MLIFIIGLIGIGGVIAIFGNLTRNVVKVVDDSKKSYYASDKYQNKIAEQETAEEARQKKIRRLQSLGYSKQQIDIETRVENKDSDLSKLLAQGRKAHGLDNSSKPRSSINNSNNRSLPQLKNDRHNYPRVSSQEFQRLKPIARTGNINALETLAVNGDIFSQNKLGQMYLDGDQVGKNFSKSFDWTLMAAENNNKESQQRLEKLYTNGWGTTRDLGKASYWRRKYESL